MGDVDLTSRYLGLELANPIVASSSPLTRQVDTMHELVAAGVGALVALLSTPFVRPGVPILLAAVGAIVALAVPAGPAGQPSDGDEADDDR